MINRKQSMSLPPTIAFRNHGQNSCHALFLAVACCDRCLQHRFAHNGYWQHTTPRLIWQIAFRLDQTHRQEHLIKGL